MVEQEAVQLQTAKREAAARAEMEKRVDSLGSGLQLKKRANLRHSSVGVAIMSVQQQKQQQQHRPSCEGVALGGDELSKEQILSPTPGYSYNYYI